MVKGISRQVIVVQSPDTKLFEQAIFILNDSAIGQDGITDEALLKEANRIAGMSSGQKHRLWHAGFFWAACGSMLTGIIWLICALL